MKTVREVIERGRATRGKVSYGWSGMGSISYLTGEILGQPAGTELLHNPFKSSGQACPDAINGTITRVIDSLPLAMQHLKSGGPVLRALLLAGGRAVVHCRGGLGRAGTVAARMLVEVGVQPAEAIRRVRAARPQAIETSEQAAYLMAPPRSASPDAVSGRRT